MWALNLHKSGKYAQQLFYIYRGDTTVVTADTLEDPQIPVEDFQSYEALAKRMNLDVKEILEHDSLASTTRQQFMV